MSSRSLTLLLAATALLGACGAEDDVSSGADAVQQQLRDDSATFANRSIEELRGDPAALALASQLFTAHCASCHGPTGEGNLSKGVMNLVDGVFNYGNSVGAVRQTIMSGRHGVMPGVGNQYGEMSLGQLVAYVESLSSNEPPSRLGQQGKLLFDESCVSCHGSDGRGNPELGGANLTDAYWLHGDTMMAIRLVITRGAEGICPAREQSLTPTEGDLLTAFVLNLQT